MTPKELDRRLIQSRKALAAWARRGSPMDRAQVSAELGALQKLLELAPPEKRAKIEALMARYAPHQ